MPRTQGRPLVTGAVTPRAALTFALGIELLAFVWLATLVNVLSAALALSATLFYVFVYTLWLKRTSSHNIVIGGAAGAVPVLVGWAAVTNSLAWPPVVLFVLIFLWTPPHFWALAIRYADDYRAADVPMLPAVETPAVVCRKMLTYALLQWAASVVLWPVAGLGLLYGVTAMVTGAAFAWLCYDLRLDPTPKRAMRVFSWSISYITVLFVAIAADTVIVYGW
jgi:protoheme IX farnesyltransferase